MKRTGQQRRYDMRKTLNTIVRDIENIKTDVEDLQEPDLKMVDYYLRLLQLRIMRLREKRKREGHNG